MGVVNVVGVFVVDNVCVHKSFFSPFTYCAPSTRDDDHPFIVHPIWMWYMYLNLLDTCLAYTGIDSDKLL